MRLMPESIRRARSGPFHLPRLRFGELGSSGPRSGATAGGPASEHPGPAPSRSPLATSDLC